MQPQIEQATDDERVLRRCMSDLIGLVALPSMWSTAEPAQIAQTLSDVLVRMLRLDFVYLQLHASADGHAIEWVRTGPHSALRREPPAIGAQLRQLLGADPSAWPPCTRQRIGGVDLSCVRLFLGMHGEIGVLVAASERPDFAQTTEAVLLNVAVAQAVVALQSARLLGERTRRAQTLDDRVAERTSELARANAALRHELSERMRVEAALRESEHDSRSIIDGIPGLVASLTPTGAVEAANRQILEYTGQTLDGLQGWRTNGLIHPDDLAHAAEIFARSIAAGVPYVIEQRLRRFDGAYRWFGNRGIPSFDAAGRIVRWFVLWTDVDERRRVEEALRAREVELRQIIDNIPVHIALLSPSGSVELINRQILDYSGQTRAELENRGLRDLVHAEDRAHAVERFEHGLAAKQPFELVYRLRRFDGVYRWFQARHRPLLDSSGRVAQWCVSVNDLDDQKRAEDALRESERTARLIVDSIPGLVSTLTPDGELENANRQLVDYTGRTLDELRPWGTSAALHPDDVARSSQTLAHAITHGEPYDVELRIRRFDGCYRWFQARGLPLRDPSGKIVRWYNLDTDITERKQAEEQLRRSEAFLEEGQRLSSMGSFSWRVDSEAIAFSDELYRIFEFERDAPVTLAQLRERVHPDDVPLLIQNFELARSGVHDEEYDLRLLMPDGRVKYLRVVARAIAQPGGRLECLGTIQDITERRLSEDALEKVRSELAHVTRTMSLGVLTASIAHEVNQPLAGIITNANTCLRMLAAEPPNVAGALETARRTIRDGNRASDVISRLHALFRKREVAAEQVDLNEATREVIALSWQDLQRRRITLQADLDVDLPRVRGDRVQLQQVILNLLSNASDAMTAIDDRARQITIRSALDEAGAVRLSVRDTGVGLAPESRAKLFDAFYTTKTDGMGIGLSVSRSIIESHSGRLWCEANDGPGATFAFSIPGG